MEDSSESTDEHTKDVPPTPPKPEPRRIDTSDPWYRPAKQFLRRQQWNAGILRLLNKLESPNGEVATIRYVGLPGQHYLDLLSMGRICQANNLQIDYLGFRTGDGPNAQPEVLSELKELSNQTHFSQTSITYPDNICNIGRPNSIATSAFVERAPFDVVNLDVCGGILHHDSAPLLAAIKFIIHVQVERQSPWLLFVTTFAKAETIEKDTIIKFFSAISTNCSKVEKFQQRLDECSKKLGIAFQSGLSEPATLGQDGFLRYFTLAFGKWLLGNLSEGNPRATVSLRSVYSFANTDQQSKEMLSLAFLICPINIGGGADPTGLTTTGIPSIDQTYRKVAMELIVASLESMQDLDQSYETSPVKTQVIKECEDLLAAIGVDEKGLEEWRQCHVAR